MLEPSRLARQWREVGDGASMKRKDGIGIRTGRKDSFNSLLVTPVDQSLPTLHRL